MKTTLLVLTLLTALLGCKDEGVKDNSLIGEWSLMTFEPGFSPMETYSKGDIIWKFQQTNTLNIQMSDNVKVSPIKKEGIYEFSVSQNRISVHKVSYDYSIDTDTLIISDNPSADGFKATFLRERLSTHK